MKTDTQTNEELFQFGHKYNNINWRDVQTKNVVNNVDMSCLSHQTPL